jgi:perosamine synthetase
LTAGLQGLPGLRTPLIGADRSHVYYVYPMQVDTNLLGVSRDRICDALNSEGVAVSRCYQNVHLLPVYQRKIAYGSQGFPWSSDICRRQVDYSKGICPVAEKLNEETYMGFGMYAYDLDRHDICLVVEAFQKVWANLGKLR